MNIDINIDDYVSDEEKKALCIEYIRESLKGGGNVNHRERVLCNMAYNAAYKIIDDTLTKEDMKTIKTKTKEILLDKSNFGVFRRKDAWGQEDSEAWVEVKKAIETHKSRISDLVKDVIVNRDYQKDIDGNVDYIADSVIAIFKKGLEG